MMALMRHSQNFSGLMIVPPLVLKLQTCMQAAEVVQLVSVAGCAVQDYYRFNTQDKIVNFFKC